jgi:hypothetical protein
MEVVPTEPEQNQQVNAASPNPPPPPHSVAPESAKKEGAMKGDQKDQARVRVQEEAQEWALSDDMRYDAMEDRGEDVDKEEEKPSSGGFLEDIPNALSLTELVKRRKGKVSKLIELYKEQYWLLADELCARAQRFQRAVASTSEQQQHDDKDDGKDVKQYASFSDYYKEGRQNNNNGGRDAEMNTRQEGQGQAVPLPNFSDLERDAFSEKVRLDPKQSQKESMLRRRRSASARLSSIVDLEKTCFSIFSRRAKKKGALACLVGKRAKFYLSRPEVSLGRNTKFQTVDIDLSEEGSCSKVSRQQGMIRMHSGGSFYFQNFGQRKVRVDNVVVPYKRRIVLENGSLVDVGGLRFVFLRNPFVATA